MFTPQKNTQTPFDFRVPKVGPIPVREILDDISHPVEDSDVTWGELILCAVSDIVGHMAYIVLVLPLAVADGIRRGWHKAREHTGWE